MTSRCRHLDVFVNNAGVILVAPGFVVCAISYEFRQNAGPKIGSTIIFSSADVADLTTHISAGLERKNGRCHVCHGGNQLCLSGQGYLVCDFSNSRCRGQRDHHSVCRAGILITKTGYSQFIDCTMVKLRMVNFSSIALFAVMYVKRANTLEGTG